MAIFKRVGNTDPQRLIKRLPKSSRNLGRLAAGELTDLLETQLMFTFQTYERVRSLPGHEDKSSRLSELADLLEMSLMITNELENREHSR